MDYFTSRCGYISHSGSECGNWKVEGSTVNLCMEHLYAAYEFVRDNLSSIEPRTVDNTLRCPTCRTITVSHAKSNPDFCECDSCGFQGERKDFLRNSRLDIKRPKKDMLDESVSVVYYIQHGNRIKIGTSTVWIQRLASLPHDRVLGLEPGGRAVEYKRHMQFRDSRVGATEWFEESNELWDHIVKLNETHPEFNDAIDRHNRRKRNPERVDPVTGPVHYV